MSTFYESLNPATEEIIRDFPCTHPDHINVILDRAAAQFQRMKKQSPTERATQLKLLATALENNTEKFAQLITTEMGKPIVQARAEIKKCAWVCRYIASEGPSILSKRPVETEAKSAYVSYEPIGPILAIMPWNFPFWQVLRVAAAQLMVGNPILLKHAQNTPQCALAIEHIITEVFEEPALQNLFLSHDQIAGVIADSRIRGITLTGGKQAAENIGMYAGRHLKKCVMELGGSDSFNVFEDANLKEAANIGAWSRCLNNGQSCIAAKRFFVHRDISESFQAALIDELRHYSVGNPLKEHTNIGPLATRKQRTQIEHHIRDAVQKGAKIAWQGEHFEKAGFYIAPTILINVPNHASVSHEETFGPIIPITLFDDDDTALALANDSSYGLGASLWTHNPNRIDRFCKELEVGMVFVNDMVKSDPRLPFGGIKDSGFGRELGIEGLLEFCNIKSIWQK